MELEIVRGIVRSDTPSQLLINALEKVNNGDKGTLFLGYLLKAADQKVITVDALLVSEKYGAVSFIFGTSDLSENFEKYDQMYYQVESTLTQYESLRRGRKLALTPNVISFFPEAPQIDGKKQEDYLFADEENLEEIMLRIEEVEEHWFVRLQEALQKVSTMKPKKDRTNVSKSGSLGEKIKRIEKEIANLDQWQKKAAFEVPEGPQRVRGLAGSGKTVVLALKAAYLHAQHPEWNIAVTFYSRALGQQFKDMITNFSFEYLGHKPDMSKLHILHAWGTDTESGIYSLAARSLNTTPLNFSLAKTKYGRDFAFEGACDELNAMITKDYKPFFDAILIDEAQDMPSSFFKICYSITKDPKRIVFAYDELQNLSNASMPDISELFGKDEQGFPLVQISNNPNSPQQDIVLPICYRNTRWALTIAHSLGFGIYRNGGPVQLFKDMNLWSDIGYRRVSGDLSYGQSVQLKRKEESSPRYFDDLISSDESIEVKKFDSQSEQYAWIASEIENDVKNEELDFDDILVIFPDAYYSKSEYMDFRKHLLSREIDSMLVGVTSERDIFRKDNIVTCSNIYRAKGNEAPKVYIVNSNHCAIGSEMIKLRNTLFTAVTRSRAWVKICGYGEEMNIITQEVQKCVNLDFTLDFRIPTEQELERLRLIHGDKTEEQKQKIDKAKHSLNEIMDLYEKGLLDSTTLPQLDSLLSLIRSEQNNENSNE